MNKLSKVLVILSVCLFSAFAVYVSLSRQDFRILGVAVAIPFALFLMNHGGFLLASVFVLMYSAVVLPGFPRDAQLFHLLAIYFLMLWIAGGAIQTKKQARGGFPKFPVILFVMNVLIVILIRGTGFRALGDTSWGGYRYVMILLPLIFLIAVRGVLLSPKQWDLTFKLMLAFAFIPMISEFIFLASGGRFYHMYFLIQLRSFTISTFQAAEMETDVVRFFGAKNAGLFSIIGALTLVRFREWRKFVTCAIILAGIALIAYSGHRASIMEIFILLWLYGLFYLKISKFNYVIFTCLGGLVFLILLYAVAPHLPFPVQRAVSFLPGIRISHVAMQSAVGTLEWRLDVWAEAWRELSMNLDYLLIGRGYTYSGAEMEVLQMSPQWEYHYWWAVITASYHNGPLSLLIGLGIPGLILGLFLMWLHLQRCFRFSSGNWAHPRLKIYFDVLLYYNCSMVFIFLLIYGDAYSNFSIIFWRAAMLEGIAYTNERSLSQANKDKASGGLDDDT